MSQSLGLGVTIFFIGDFLAGFNLTLVLSVLIRNDPIHDLDLIYLAIALIARSGYLGGSKNSVSNG